MAFLLQWPAALLVPLLLLVHGGSLLRLQLPNSVDAQNATTATGEVEAFKAIFKKWGITSSIKWNTTEDPCSGLALINSTSISDISYSPFVKCDCSYDNGTTCHITALKVRDLDVVGEIPNELWNLSFLTYLSISRNHLTGSISPSVGNLKQLQWLYFQVNALTGNLPKELGQHTSLKSLSFGTNNFSGSLPSEIGNIVGLQELYMSSSGVSGKIPSSFANLVNLQRFSASDTELSGSLPDFIGLWSQLMYLSLHGNSFVGSIPSSFSNLTALQTLRIGDLSDGSSSLAFITNLTSLSILVLRNINFSDPIPAGIGGLASLIYLDLSFNNIRGEIPDQLFSLGSLSHLFLGNNKLTGSLPRNKNSSLVNISEDKKVLVTEFLHLMESSCFFDILDPRIAEEAKEEGLWAVAKLAKRCWNMNGKHRPTMKEVAMTLESIRSFPVANPVEEICLEINHTAHEINKTCKCPFCLRSFPLQDASSSSSVEVLPLLSNYTF